jgi:integrase
MVLSEIIAQDIETWHTAIDGGPRAKNTALATLRVMLGEAHRLGLVPANVAEKVAPVVEPAKVRELFRKRELLDLFESEAAVEVWEDEPLAELACRVIYRTGMRAGEILGLKPDCLVEEEGQDWLIVQRSWDRKEIRGTKGGKTRRVTIPLDIAEALRALKGETGYYFSQDGGLTLMAYDHLREVYVRALEAIGILMVEQTGRGLGLHAFCHWLNTNLRARFRTTSFGRSSDTSAPT